MKDECGEGDVAIIKAKKEPSVGMRLTPVLVSWSKEDINYKESIADVIKKTSEVVKQCGDSLFLVSCGRRVVKDNLCRA